MSTTTLRGVTVVDTRDGSLAPDMDVTLTGDRITSVTHAGGEPTGTPVDVAGKYLVPGYLDMHAHPLELKDPAGTLELMLANGITGFRQMSGSPKMLQQRAAGTLPLRDDSPALLAMPGTVLTPLNAGTDAVAVATVAEQYTAGADFIKVGFVPPDVFFAAQAEAGRLGIPILGHLPVNIDVIRASRNGIRSIEHLGPGLGILAACSSDETGVRAKLAAQTADQDSVGENPLHGLDRGPAGPPDGGQPDRAVPLGRRRADAAHRRHVRRGQGAGAGLAVRRRRHVAVSDPDPQAHQPDVRRQRVPQRPEPAVRRRSHRQGVGEGRGRLRETSGQRAHGLPQRVRPAVGVTKLLDDSGVPMLAGSDACGAVWEIPGYALHQEFDLLAEAGLAPLRILQMTTLNGAEFLGTTASMGTVEVGKNADLVLLGANPVEDAAHLHDVAGVVRAGRYYSAAELDGIKRHVAASKSVQ